MDEIIFSQSSSEFLFIKEDTEKWYMCYGRVFQNYWWRHKIQLLEDNLQQFKPKIR